ncbi:MAG: hypothetical protein WCO25_05595 [Candidatus Uhrbacteria bacterium]
MAGKDVFKKPSRRGVLYRFRGGNDRDTEFPKKHFEGDEVLHVSREAGDAVDDEVIDFAFVFLTPTHHLPQHGAVRRLRTFALLHPRRMRDIPTLLRNIFAAPLFLHTQTRPVFDLIGR